MEPKYLVLIALKIITLLVPHASQVQRWDGVLLYRAEFILTLATVHPHPIPPAQSGSCSLQLLSQI